MGFGGLLTYSAYGFTGGPALLSTTPKQITPAPTFLNGVLTQVNPTSNSHDCFLLYYDALSANVIVGTTIPKLIVPVVGGSYANVQYPKVIEFATALTVAMVMTSPTGSTAPTTSFGVDTYFS